MKALEPGQLRRRQHAATTVRDIAPRSCTRLLQRYLAELRPARWHPEGERPRCSPRQFFNPRPVSDELLNQLTARSILAAKEEGTNAILPQCSNLSWIPANVVVSRDQEKVIIADVSQPLRIGRIFGEMVFQVIDGLTESAHAASELCAEIIVDKKSHAASASSNATAASTSGESRLIQEATAAVSRDSA